MNLSTKLAALTPVAVAAVGVTQFHYVISHFSTIAELGAAVAVGAAIWTGKAASGRRKAARQSDIDSPPVVNPAISWAVDYSKPVVDPVAHVDWDKAVREYQLPKH